MENNISVPNNNPWKGLKFYNEGEILYGRNDDIQALSQYVINNTQTVLYGKSGIGKSSILNAGVFPVARKNGLFPVPVRFEHNSTLTYVQQLSAAIMTCGLESHEIVPVINSEEESLWEFIHRQYFTICGKEEIVQPLFVIDQFEEIFTLQKNEKTKLLFFSQLADLLNNVRPKYINDKINSDTFGIVEESAEKSNESANIDDFSFDISFDTPSDEPQCDYIESPAYHIVFAMREDFLSYLERYTSYIPVMKNNRFGLSPINEEQAAEIIMQPRPGLVDPNVAEHIIQKVTGREDFTLDGIPEIEVDSAVLSLYLSRLYEKKSPKDEKLTNELVDEFGNDIIRDFYLESIADIPANIVDILESQLLTKDGRRNNVSRSDLESNGIPSDIINTLVNDKKILRQFSYGDDMRVEFIHDILCSVVLKHIEDKELEMMKNQQKALEEKRHNDNRKRNQERIQNDLNVLTVRGRQLIDNTVDFGNFENSRHLQNSGCNFDTYSDLYTILDYYFRYTSHEEVNVSSIGRLIDVGKGSTYTTCIEFKDAENNPIRTNDGISKMQVMFDGNLIKQINFIKYHVDYQGICQEIPFYIHGFCAISLSYDKMGREIRRIYLDELNKPTLIYGGYAIIERQYDGNGNISCVKYFDVNGEPAEHWNGNHGFISKYNDDGLEIKRVFIDRDLHPTNITSGIFGRIFKYDSKGRLSYEANLDANMNITSDNKGYYAIRFEYDEESRILCDKYLDANDNLIMPDSRYAITKMTYGENSSVTEMYYDTYEKPVSYNDSYGTFIKLNDKLQTVEFTELDINGNLSGKNKDTHIFWDEDGLLQKLMLYDGNGQFLGGKWVNFDNHNLFIKFSGELNANGQKEADNDGGYGQMYERDKNGFVCALWNINLYCQPIPSDDGISVHRINLENGNIVKRMFYDENGSPKQDNEGSYGYNYVFDVNNNTKIIICLNELGEPAPNNFGILKTENKFNSDSDLISEYYYDENNKLCADENGNCGLKYEYSNDNLETKIFSLNEFGEPQNNEDGWCFMTAEKDSKGRLISTRAFNIKWDGVPLNGDIYENQTIYNDNVNEKLEKYLGNEGQLVEDEDGTAIYYYKYDKLGRIVMKKIYDKNNVIICNSDGANTLVYEYSDDGREKIVKYLDENCKYHSNNDGIAMRRFVYDEKGREIEEFYYGENEEPVKDENGYGVRTIYTDQDNKYIYMNLDRDGSPLYSTYNGYYAIMKELDSKQRIIEQHYLDAELKPMCISNGSYGVHCIYDDNENSEEYYFFDIDGNPTENEYGIAFNYEINDENGKLIYECGYDKNHNPKYDSINVFATKYTYLDDGLRQIEYFDEDGNHMISSEGYGGLLKQFDDQERQISLICLDIDGNPIEDEYGVSGWNKEFLDDGRVLFTNINGKGDPIADSDGEICTLLTLDENGNNLVKICLDAELEPHPCNNGWIRRDNEYNEEGNVISNLFYDADGNPMQDNNGDYGLKLIETDNPNEEILAYLGPDGKAHISKNGYAYRQTIYDEQRRPIFEFKLDKHKSPIMDDTGTFGTGYEYNDDGSKLICCLDDEGNPMATKSGYTFIQREFDEKDRIIKEMWFDIDKNPFCDEDGDYGVSTCYDDENNTIDKVSLNENGEPHNNNQGWCINRNVNDEKGRNIIDVYYNVDGSVYIDENGFCMFETEYINDEDNHRMYRNLDIEGKPIAVNSGKCGREVWLDDKGRTIKQKFYKTDGSPFIDEDGAFGQIAIICENDNGCVSQKIADFDINENLILQDGGYYYWENKDDEFERTIKQMWFDSNLMPYCNENGSYGIAFEYIGMNQEPFIITQLDIDGNPHDNNKGICHEYRIYNNEGEYRWLEQNLNNEFVDQKEE